MTRSVSPRSSVIRISSRVWALRARHLTGAPRPATGHAVVRGASALRVGPGGLGAGGVALASRGEAEEHVLQALARPQVGDGQVALGQQRGEPSHRGRRRGRVDAVLARSLLGHRHAERGADGANVDARRRGEADLLAARDEIGGAAGRDDLPAVDDDEPVGETLGLAELVGRDEDADALLAQARHDVADDDAAGGVDARRRLVEEGHSRPAYQRERERQALALATGEPLCRGTGDVFEADQAEQFTRVAWVVVVGGEEPERSSGAHHRVGAATLEHHADERRDGRPVASGIVAEDADVAGVGDAVALQRLDRGRLAGAVRAEQAEDLARLGAERDAVDGDRPAVADDELFDFDGRHRRRG